MSVAHCQGSAHNHSRRALSVRCPGAFTALIALIALTLGACASGGQTYSARSYAAGSAAHTQSEGASPLHGFDPRAYYNRPAISTQRGAASFYADRFAGRLTANGERYDPKAFTAAHRTLPFGSIVRVVHEKTGDWVLVRINDRGPYGPKGRVIDLSRQAATRLAILREGVARVRVELLERGSGKRVKAAGR